MIVELLKIIANSIIPLFIVFVVMYGSYRRVNVYDSFIVGAEDGFKTVYRILPYIIGMLFAINIFRASGALDILNDLLYPVFRFIGLPKELTPLALLRPFSGSASLSLLADIYKQYGADSMISRIASTMMGSTETIFYTVALYFGSVKIKKTRYTVPAALLSSLAGIIAAIFICNITFV